MVLGFMEVIESGRSISRVTKEQTLATSTSGYLTEEEFSSAKHYYRARLSEMKEAKYRGIAVMAELELSHLGSILEEQIDFNQRLELLKNHPETRVATKDASEIGRLFQLATPLDELVDMQDTWSRCSHVLASLEVARYYSGDFLTKIANHEAMARKLTSSIKGLPTIQKDEVQLLVKYTDKWLEKDT
jgi:hypothetical protein